MRRVKAPNCPLQLEAKIPLGDVRGRIDHMAVDLARRRLFVAALGNDSLAVVDLEAKRLDRLIGELPEPQGVGYDPATDTLYVANAGDGSVRLFKGAELSPIGRIELGSAVADKYAPYFRIHANVVGVAKAPSAHPESFQLDGNTSRVFVNVPNSGAIDVVDRTSGEKIASWSTAGRSANFAMALDHARQHVLVP